MTTANASATDDTKQPTVEDDGQRELGDTILTGQDGAGADDAAETAPEVAAAMSAGWAKARGTKEEVTDVQVKKTDAAEVTEPSAAKDPVPNPGAAEDDIEVPGLGKASDIRKRLDRMEALEKAVASTSGHVGHLKQLVASAGKGKTITKESLKHVAAEFGDEFADAFAKDLSAAGIGGGGTVDPEALRAIVEEQVSAATEARTRKLEKLAVSRAHPDADDYFAAPELDEKGQHKVDANGAPVWKPGKHNAAFLQFIGTLPAARQTELQENGWDAAVVTKALDEFKAHRDKAANQQATQNRRMERGVVPTGSRGGAVAPSVDPMRAGWEAVRGKNARAAVHR